MKAMSILVAVLAMSLVTSVAMADGNCDWRYKDAQGKCPVVMPLPPPAGAAAPTVYWTPARIQQSLCNSVAYEKSQVKMLKDAIARELHNPTGVIDLEELHELGECLQIEQDRINAGLKACAAIKLASSKKK